MFFDPSAATVTAKPGQFDMEPDSIFHIPQNQRIPLVDTVFPVNGRVTIFPFHFGFHFLHGYFFFYLVPPDAKEPDRIENDDLIHYVPDCRFPIDRLQHPFDCPRCRDIITDTFCFQLRPGITGKIAGYYDTKIIRYVLAHIFQPIRLLSLIFGSIISYTGNMTEKFLKQVVPENFYLKNIVSDDFCVFRKRMA